MNGGFAIRRGRKAAWSVLLAGLAISAGCGTPSPPGEPTARSKFRAEFDQLLEIWKPFLNELRQVRTQYAAAEPDLRPELEEQYAEMVKKGNTLEADLVYAGVIACVKQPEENKDLADFLMEIARTLLMQEEYEDALRMSQTLIDHRVGDFSMYYCAAISAFAVGEFEVSEQHFQLLQEKQMRLAGARNPFKEIVNECRTDLPYYKQAWKAERELREQEELAGDLPRVRLKTSKGDIDLELFENEAPNTVANFISLVEKGFYDGLTFHRVLPRSLAQAGCPKGDGSGGPEYTIRCECYQPNHRLHFRGSVSMAVRARDTGGSQFFITFRPRRQLDGQHTVFGRVVRGMDVLARLQRRDPDRDPDSDPANETLLPKPDTILEAKVLSKRNHPYDPKVTPDEKPDEITKKLMEELPEGFMPF